MRLAAGNSTGIRGEDENAGTFRFRNQFFNFVGDTIGGRPNGDGTLRLENGVTVHGSFSEGEIVGQGTKRWPNGSLLQTTFVNGEAHGFGRHFNVGTMQDFEGSLSKGFRCGYGVLTDHRRSTVFKGFFEKDMPEGKGVLLALEGAYFSPLEIKGYWRRGLLQGPALATFGDGDTMIGTAVEGLWEGDGKFTSSHIVYHGPFEKGKRGAIPSLLHVSQFTTRRLRVGVPSRPIKRELAVTDTPLANGESLSVKEQMLGGVQRVPFNSTAAEVKSWGVVSQGASMCIVVCLAISTQHTVSIEIPPTEEEIRLFVAKNKGKKGTGPFVQHQPPSEHIQVTQFGARALPMESGRKVSLKAYRIEDFLQNGRKIQELDEDKFLEASMVSSIKVGNVSMASTARTANSTQVSAARLSVSISQQDALGASWREQKVEDPLNVTPSFRKRNGNIPPKPTNTEADLTANFIDFLKELPYEDNEDGMPTGILPVGVNVVELGVGATPRQEFLPKVMRQRHNDSPSSTIRSNGSKKSARRTNSPLGPMMESHSAPNLTTPRVPAVVIAGLPFPTKYSLEEEFVSGRATFEFFLVNKGRHIVEMTVNSQLRVVPGDKDSEQPIQLRRYIPILVEDVPVREVSKAKESDEEEEE